METKARGMSAAEMAIAAFVAVETPEGRRGAAEMPGGDATDFLGLEAMVCEVVYIMRIQFYESVRRCKKGKWERRGSEVRYI